MFLNKILLLITVFHVLRKSDRIVSENKSYRPCCWKWKTLMFQQEKNENLDQEKMEKNSWIQTVSSYK
jgi:hypothetical protein